MTTLTYQQYKDLLQIMCLLEDKEGKVTYIIHRGDGIFEITVDDTQFLSGTTTTSLFRVFDGKVQRKNVRVGLS